MKRLILSMMSVVLASLPARGQVAAPLTFEVASVKVAASGPNGVQGGCRGTDSVYTAGQQTAAPPLGRCRISDARLSHLIGIAWGVMMRDLKAGPDWILGGDLRFNVEAKAENPSAVTEKQLLTMLQNLLVERFQLKFHFDRGETAGFSLTVAKNGPRLKASQSEDAAVSFAGPNGEAYGKPTPNQPVKMTVRKYSVPMLINILTLLGNGPGEDKTGLSGAYDFTLSWDNEAGPDLSTALREQLGLRLDATKLPSSTFVIDSAQKPAGN